MTIVATVIASAIIVMTFVSFMGDTMSDGELRKVFRKYLHTFDSIAVETGGTAGGVPDFNMCKNGIDVWVEMKAARHWRAVIRPSQVGWIERRLLHGGRVFIAIRRDMEELWLYHGVAIRTLIREPLDTIKPLGAWAGGPRDWDWVEIERILLHEPTMKPL